MSESRRRRCLITGATGAVGPSVVKSFLAAGYAVRILARRQPRPGELPDGIETVVGDVLDAPLAAAIRDVDVVVHLAALLHVVAPARELLPQYKRVNVEGTRRLIAAAIESGVSRFVYFSTIAVYGSGAGRIIDESTPPSPETPYAESKLAAEQLVLNATRGDVRIGVVLRFASVYGVGVKGNYQSLVRALQRGRYIPIGRGQNRRTVIHQDDAGQAAVLAAETPAAAGAVFNVTDGLFHTVAEIVDYIAAALGKTAPRFYLPVGPVRVAAATFDLILPFVHARVLLNKYLEDMAVDGGRFHRSVGFVPRVDLRTGWQTTIRRMRDAGML